jgi:protein ImuA
MEHLMPRLSGSARNSSLPPQNRENGGIPTELKELKARIRRLEGFGGSLVETARPVLPFGVAEIDAHLPGGGLMRGALHEVFAADAGIATAFCALLAGRLAADTENHSILWCERPWALDAGALYGPALLQFGIDPARLILVRARRDADALWAMEEGLRCDRLAAVVGEITDISLTASRRLQLAAEDTGITALALRPKTDKPVPSAAATRWRLDAVEHQTGHQTGHEQAHIRSPNRGANQANDNAAFTGMQPGPPGGHLQSGPPGRGFQSGPPGLGAARWQAELFRCRGGTSANWMMEWDDETGNFSMAAKICDRPTVPSAARLAG